MQKKCQRNLFKKPSRHHKVSKLHGKHVIIEENQIVEHLKFARIITEKDEIEACKSEDENKGNIIMAENRLRTCWKVWSYQNIFFLQGLLQKKFTYRVKIWCLHFTVDHLFVHSFLNFMHLVVNVFSKAMKILRSEKLRY